MGKPGRARHILYLPFLRRFVEIGTLTVIGFLAAYALNRFVFPGRILTATILILPILIPPLILGVAMLGLLSRLGLHGQLYSIIIAHTLLLTLLGAELLIIPLFMRRRRS